MKNYRQNMWFADPSHAWLRVPLKELNALGIADKISYFSYMDEKFAYLEEDCDAPTYLQKVGKRSGDFPEFHTNKESKVRKLSNYYFKVPLVSLNTNGKA